MNRKIITGLLFVLLSLSVFSQDSNLTRKFIKELSSPDMFGRGYSYKGDSLAAGYIRNQFIDMGIAPLGEHYYQHYNFNAYAIEGAVSLTIDNKQLSSFHDYRIAPFSKSLKKTLRIIQVKPEILLTQKAIDHFNNKYGDKLMNSIIYIDIEKLKNKEQELVKSLKKEVSKLNFQNPFCKSAGIALESTELPVWSLSNTDFLRNYALIHIKSGIIGKKSKLISINFENRFASHRTQNVAGIVQGTLYPDSFIVFTAHYDHLGSMGDSVIFCGAHDNASGTATVLNLANYYKSHPLPYSTVFVLFSGEEAGLKGSFYFAGNPLIPLERIKILLNLDMMGGGDRGIMVVNAQDSLTKEFFNTLVETNFRNQYLDTVKGRANAANSDHYPFSQKGVPAIFIFSMGGKTGSYHHWSDTNENCSLTKWEGIFRLLVNTIEAVTTEPDLIQPSK